ncbi:galactokinase [Sinomicrobium soli]|uniref:galactokinase n=1 Tax=Sinomicrobium sp. N-1-3-6 TaxID=2219864 RepID=UPI000DCDE14F|nr:galactokinase [Sinomicrobium sp. N-1-3-6]RAV30044.1 galactokinase [Sinomicrobium sp. N-1-3-6]
MTTQALKDRINTLFKEKYNGSPLLIQSPGRINIIGEHTDYNDGFVLPGAIDRYIISAMARNGSPDECRVFAADMDEEIRFSLDDVKPSEKGSWQNYVLGVVSEIGKRGVQLQGFDIVFGGNIPKGSGLSSSAALENAITFGLNELFGIGMSRTEMMLLSQKAEHNFVGVQCGIMDQFASMQGKGEHVLLLDCRSLDFSPVAIDFSDYEILLINSNVKHSLADSAYNDRRESCESGVRILQSAFPEIKALRDASETQLSEVKDRLDPDTYEKCLYVIQENDRVQEAVKAIKNNDIPLLGSLLFQSHAGLEHQYEVSCPELDFLVEKARENNDILGSRMMGGGFGGCTINIIRKGAAEAFVASVEEEYTRKFDKKPSIYNVALTDGTGISETVFYKN